MIPFEEYIRDNLVLLDGAMGSLIYEKGVFIDKCYDELNLSRPDLIKSIHEDYIRSGAKVIESNTYGANRFKLKSHNLLEHLGEINRKGVELAREAAGGNAYVAGSMGPVGEEIEPWGEITLEQVSEAYAEQAGFLEEAGVDLFILETIQDIREMEQAVTAIRTISDLPVVAMMTVGEDGKTRYGVDLDDIACRLLATDASVIGLNCTVGPKPMLDFVERLIDVSDRPICVMPNAGRPQYTDGRMIYMSTPEYFSVYTKRFIDKGVRMLGGCCGTTPEHISKMANTLAMKQTRIQHSIGIGVKPVTEEPLPDPVPQPEKSNLSKKLSGGNQVVMVEMVPPRSTDITKPLEGAEILQKRGVDAINIPDGPRASARMTGLALAVLLEQKVGIETVIHYTCRDRNLLGMQSDLLGAAAMGIRNILAITGDPPMIGDYPQATAVFDIDAIGLVHLINNLNHGIDVGEKRIGDPTAFFTGVGLDPNSVNQENEIHRLQMKKDAGAEYVITQPVFDVDSLESFLEKADMGDLYLIAGIWPLVSLRNAEFMKNEVPGVFVPDRVIEAIARYETKEDQLKAGIEIAQSMVERVLTVCARHPGQRPLWKISSGRGGSRKTTAMKKMIWLMVLAACPGSAVNAQLHPDWENPEVFERNQVPPHATLMPYEDLEQALDGERKSSPFHMTLNGTWKFHWAENPGNAPVDFQEADYPKGDWDEIPVPSNWQMEGFGYPLFRNIGLPHPLDPPRVPEDFNPVGSYFRTFQLPGHWVDREVFLHFEGVQSASYVWINGKEVGYNQGGMEPAEYDITPYLKSGENSIAVKVLRYCDGTYMEDQDTWRLSGIYRDVYLMATPKQHIRDFYITTDLDEDYQDATLRLQC